MIESPLWNAGALILAYLVGSLPVGSWLVRRLSGRDAADYGAHNLGVENVLQLVGARVAIAAFAADVLKGFVAMALCLGNPLAALGVYLGHLYPLPGTGLAAAPRGRGNGVLLGVLAGLAAFAGWPLWAAGLPVIVYALILALSSYVAAATLAGLAAVVLIALGLPVPGLHALAGAGVMLLALWRHKSSLARIVDGTEPRLGDPPPVHGRDPRVVRAAFMVHPMTVDDFWQVPSLQWLRWLYERGIVNDARLRALLPRLRPMLHTEFTDIALPDGRELRVMIITGPLLPDMIREQPEVATRMAIQAARFARELGAEAFGLGAFWSTVGNKGLDVQEAVPDIAITNGGAYTAASVRAAVPGLLRRFEDSGGSLGAATAAIIGANGVVAFGVARSIAGDVGSLVLIGRDLERLERSAETLRRKHPHLTVTTSTDVSDAAAADLVFTATSDPDPVLFAEHVRPGAWVFDIGRPADVDGSVLGVPGVQVIPGGVVRPPGSMRANVDIHFGDGLVPACMAETMIMTATRSFDRASLGPATRSANIDFYLQEGEHLGFEIVTRDQREADGDPDTRREPVPAP